MNEGERDKIPKIAAFRTEKGGLAVLCIFCGCMHQHGGIGGERSPHCRFNFSDFEEGGERKGTYNLVIVAHRSPEAMTATIPIDAKDVSRAAERIWRVLDERRHQGTLDRKRYGTSVPTAEYIRRLLLLVASARTINKMELTLHTDFIRRQAAVENDI